MLTVRRMMKGIIAAYTLENLKSFYDKLSLSLLMKNMSERAEKILKKLIAM